MPTGRALPKHRARRAGLRRGRRQDKLVLRWQEDDEETAAARASVSGSTRPQSRGNASESAASSGRIPKPLSKARATRGPQDPKDVTRDVTRDLSGLVGRSPPSRETPTARRLPLAGRAYAALRRAPRVQNFRIGTWERPPPIEGRGTRALGTPHLTPVGWSKSRGLTSPLAIFAFASCTWAPSCGGERVST